MPSVFIKTYGCQMNERDSEAVAAQLVARGYSLAPSEAGADVVLLNTCSVRDLAEQKALGKMRAVIGAANKHRPAQVVGFMGCMAQSRGRELLDRLPDLDLVLGTQKFHRAADYLDDLLAGRRQAIVDVEEEPGSEAAIREHTLAGDGRAPVSAFVSIMQGCNQHCTFCIVPSTRGAERSRTIPDIVAECRDLVARGTREITLLGQIVTSYGRRMTPAQEPARLLSRPAATLSSIPNGGEGRGDEAHGFQGRGTPEDAPPLPGPLLPRREERGKSAFVQLLEAVHEIEGLERIRFTSPHPKGYGDDLVEAYGRLPKLVESAHIPVQSGSDRILKLMHRGYTRERFLGILAKLRAVRPGMGITTDIIVGFPGETEDDFAQTLSLTREARFQNAFVFKYSPRRDTPAATMPEQVPVEVIEERHARLLDLVNEIGHEHYTAAVGTRQQILVEGPSHKNAARLQGRTRCNKIVIFDGAPRHLGQLMDVRITRAGTFTLYGDPAIVNLN
jgi:tRNA-2-methylthio-N6-dimethylallyladenosine synthase